MDGSTTRRIAPARAYILAVLNNAGHCRIATRIGEHLLATRAIILGIVFDERSTLLIVVVSRLLTIRTAGLHINN